ncbi:MAG: hypothetical protein KDA53_04975 [Hyphomonas sp.]|nr:hypothetical protein [Hyphomonas sp.]
MTAPSARSVPTRLANYALRPRPGLEKRAETILRERDVYIVAPAGYGKTGLLARMAARYNNAYLWTGTAGEFSPEAAQDADILIADISFDSNRKSLQRLRRWLEAPERTTPALLAARTDPGLGFARLVSSKRGDIWRAGDMQCSLDDLRTVVLLNERTGADASQLNELHKRCDGWIAGAVLLKSEPHATSLPQALPQSIREFYGDLLRTADLSMDIGLLSLSALPDQISPRLFQHITGSSDFFALVEHGIDLQPVPNAPGWWRYGRLLSAYLRERAMALGQSALSAAHRKISDWQLEEGAMTEAALHALQSGDRALAMNVVDQAARRFIALGQITHARSWLTQLEPEGRETYPRIWLHLVTALIVSGEFDAADCELEELESFIERIQSRHAGEDWFDEIVLHMQFNQHMLAYMHPDRRCDLPALDRLVNTPRSRDFAVRGESLFLMGLAQIHEGDTSGYKTLEASLKALPATQSWYAYATTQRHLALRDLEAGDFDACRQRCEHAMAQIIESTCFAPPCLAPIALVLAEVSLIEGDIEAAQRILSNEGTPLQVLANEDYLAEWDRLTGELHAHAGADQDAVHMFSQTFTHTTSRLGHATRRKAETALIRTLCQMGGASKARERLGKRYGLGCPPGAPKTPHQRDILEDVVRSAIVMSASGEPERARRHLLEAQSLVERRGEAVEALRILRHVQECRFREDTGSTEQRLVRDWIGQVMQAGAFGLIGEAQRGPFGHLYRDETTPARATAALRITQLDNSVQVQLTPREQETLEYMAIGYTNRQIADQTMTSLTTVKWHVRNILGKLEAQNRSAAINKARVLGLIV